MSDIKPQKKIDQIIEQNLEGQILFAFETLGEYMATLLIYQAMWKAKVQIEKGSEP